MSEAVLIYPHQLFSDHPAIAKDRKIILIEDPLYFGTDKQYPIIFHKQKLIFHRASMKTYQAFLERRGYSVAYLEFHAVGVVDLRHLRQYKKIHVADVADFTLQKRLEQFAKDHKIDLVVYDSPGFLNSQDEINAYFDKEKSYNQTKFYKQQRIKRNILITQEGHPIGGDWTYDKDNRKKLPKKIDIPPVPNTRDSKYVTEAKEYIEKHFADNYGSTDTFIYPTSHDAAQTWLDTFLQERFELFGPYEDAIDTRFPFIHHSVLSPLLNAGLLTPQLVIDEALQFYKKHDVRINSVEGFVRQIIGWREFMRAIYIREGVKQRNSNELNHTNKLTDNWYNGTTGITPVDDVIKKITTYAYAHHIERLMIIGNVMMLCEIDPNEVYKWFMELFIDAYDWVMVPNVYGMSQFADGGAMVTKPYFSGSNYILKMSNYSKGEPWCDIWDGLFWRFVDKHQDMLKKNARMRFMVSTLGKMEKEKKEKLFRKAEDFIAKVTKSR